MHTFSSIRPALPHRRRAMDTHNQSVNMYIFGFNEHIVLARRKLISVSDCNPSKRVWNLDDDHLQVNVDCNIVKIMRQRFQAKYKLWMFHPLTPKLD